MQYLHLFAPIAFPLLASLSFNANVLQSCFSGLLRQSWQQTLLYPLGMSSFIFTRYWLLYIPNIISLSMHWTSV